MGIAVEAEDKMKFSPILIIFPLAFFAIPSPTVADSLRSCFNQPAGATSSEVLGFGGRQRSYIIHLPTGFNCQRSYPLVLLFHGGHGTAPKILDQTKMPAK